MPRRNPSEYGKAKSATQLMMQGNPMFADLPLLLQEDIISWTRRGRGRPKASAEQLEKSKEKSLTVKKMRARANAALNRGDILVAQETIDRMKDTGLLGNRASALDAKLEKLKEISKLTADQYDAELEKYNDEQEDLVAESMIKIRKFLQGDMFTKNDYMEIMDAKTLIEDSGVDSKIIKKLERHIQELLNDSAVIQDLGEDTVTDIKQMFDMDERPRSSQGVEGGLPFVEQLVKSKKISPQEAVKQAAHIEASSSFSGDKEQLLQKENELVFGTQRQRGNKPTQSDLQHTFTSVDRAPADKSDTSEKIKSKTNMPFAKLPKQSISYLRDYLKKNFDLKVDFDEMEFVMDNFVDDITKEMLLENDARAGGKIGEIIQNARETQKFVPTDIEGNEDMTKEERQILFHKLMIEGSARPASSKKQATNFDNYSSMGGGINAGLETKSKKDEESKPIKLPDEFKDYEFLLDSKIKDNAMARELFKGIDPNAIIDSNNEELMNAYFARLNELSNEQDDKEINEAVDNIEILSGGNKDTLFGATDLLTTKGNLNMRFNQDMPDTIRDNPAPLSRGRDARGAPEVNIEAINRENRADYATTIASGLGVLNSAYRGIFGKNEVAASKTDILEDMNQNMRLMGKRGFFAVDKSLGADDDMYEGTTFEKRLSSLREFKDSRVYGRNNPEMLEQRRGDPLQPPAQQRRGDPLQPPAQQPGSDQLDALRNAMMFNKGQGGAQGASLQQLRQQEFAYKQANRRTVHDSRAFIRGGKSTQIQIQQEFDP